jgi:membrane-bound lytic murein transglycosylase D
MHRITLFLLFAATLAAALPAAAQTTPRRPPTDTVRFGTTRPAAGDSIAMAEYEEEDEEAAATGEDGEAEVASGAEGGAAADTVPVRPRSGPYSRASGTGPFSVQASGETAARPPRGDVVWLQGRARAAASDSARGDTARAGSGQRVAAGASTRRDTASAAGSRARRNTASAAGSRPARRDSASTASRPAPRDTAAARRNGQSASTTGGRTGSTSTTSTTTGGRTGSTSTSTSTNAGGRTGSTTTSTSGARARTHTVGSGETFFAIARRYGVTAAQLRAINPDVDQDALEVGDVLRLPAAARDSRAGSSSSSSSGSTSGSQRTGSQAAPRTGSQGGSAQRRSHTVAAGETLFGIARRYGVSVDAIRQANELEGDALRTGQRLVIPPAR